VRYGSIGASQLGFCPLEYRPAPSQTCFMVDASERPLSLYPQMTLAMQIASR